MFSNSQLYKLQENFLYQPDDSLACTILTDSTERSPTFSLPVFENFDHPQQVPSSVYLHLRGSPTTSKAWLRLMRRPIRGLNWDKTDALTGNKVVLGYDFSDCVLAKRAKHVGDSTKTTHRVRFELGGDPTSPHLSVSVGTDAQPTLLASTKVQYPARWGLKAQVGANGEVERYEASETKAALVLVNIFVKMLLNAHSTAAMGHLKRFELNIMTALAPSNYKLIDRSARYVTWLLEDALPKGTQLPTYEEIVREIYAKRSVAKADEPIVLTVRDSFLIKLSK